MQDYATSPSTRSTLRIDGPWFKDRAGRTLLLRGANLGGSSKVPATPNGATHIAEGFFDHRDASFVGRPFPLDEADEHFARLRSWGLTFLRLLTTWEAVEHAGPGRYEQEYLAYLRAIVERAAAHGIDVFIDPHQDVWSRWTGGDGAPGWTLEAIGMDLTRLAPAAAAITHQTHGDPFPRMIWPTNYARLGCATMCTLFFAGNAFAPKARIDGVPVQDYLQDHFIGAMAQVATALRGLKNVAGYDSLNEPGSGYIGLADLGRHAGLLDIRSGPSPTPFQGMLLGSGHPQEVEVYELEGLEPRVAGTQVLNPEGVSIWRDGYRDIWREHGVWEDGALLRPDYFARADFANGYLKPFILRYTEAIRRVDPDAVIFIEGSPGGSHPRWGAGDPDRVVNAPHWYDVLTLLTKSYRPDRAIDWRGGGLVHGREAAQRAYRDQIGALKESGLREMGGIPTLIGEFGLPFDLDDGAAYRTGDFSPHVAALDAYMNAMDAHLLNFTVWNYTADNTNERGDLWNGEDLSIFSRDQQSDPRDVNSGGRALAGVVRPYALATAGEPLRMRFDLATRTFELAFRADPALSAPTEIFVPRYQYPRGYAVELSAGTYRKDEERQILLIAAPGIAGEVSLKLTPKEDGA